MTQKIINKDEVDSALDWIRVQTGSDFLLVHRAALLAYGVNDTIGLPTLDVCVDDAKLRQIGFREGLEYKLNDTDVLTVRFWTSLGGKPYFNLAIGRKHFAKWDAYTPDPYLVLHHLDESPEYRFMLLPRAFLAEILYVDELSDSALAKFHSYLHDL